MSIRLLNTVILADDYERVRDWWINAVGLTLFKEWPTMPYADLAADGTIALGITGAGGMDYEVPTPRVNSTLPQFVSDDVEGLMTSVVDNGGSAVFGPSYAEDGGYWYGAFADIEGNVAWVVSPEAVPKESD